MRWIKLIGYAFLLLLAISVGVRFDTQINEFNDIYIRGKNPKDQDISGYWLNSYKPVSISSFDYQSVSSNTAYVRDQYGTKTSMGGLPVYSSINARAVEWITNDGIFFSSDLDLTNVVWTDIWKYLPSPVLQKPNGGIRGAVRLDDDRLIVYFTGTEADGLSGSSSSRYTVQLGVINLTDGVLESHLVLDSFSIEEHFALGGGMVMSPESDSVLLSIGSASGTDDIIAGAKAQRRDTLFGKVVEVGLTTNGTQRELLEPTILSTGHRNPQGMHQLDETIFAVEHGPMGGDEVNIIHRDGNYGWNIRSFGAKYSGEDGGYEGVKNDLIDPVFYFTPSIGISDVANCPDLFVKLGYRPCLTVSALRDQSIRLLKLDKNEGSYNVQSVERIELPARVRTVISSTDSIYAFLDSKRVIKITYAPR